MNAAPATGRPTTSNADEWQLWLQERTESGAAYLAVQIVEAIEEHQKALAREVYGLAEDTASRFSNLASEDTPEGHFCRGSIREAKSIARAIGAIMPYSRDPAALAFGGRERLTTKDAVPGDEVSTPPVGRVLNHGGDAIMLAALEKIAAMPPRLTAEKLAECFDYLDDLRESGVTNMFGAAPYVKRACKLKEPQAKEVLMLWMKSNRDKSPMERARAALNLPAEQSSHTA